MEENALPPSNPAPPPLNTVPPLQPPPPPPLSPPPVIAPGTPPRPPRRGRGWMVLALVLFVLLLFSMLYNVGNYASNLVRGKGSRAYGRAAGPRLEEVVRED